MTSKKAKTVMLWKAIERYRTAGGSQEHYAYKEALDNYIDDILDVSEMDEVAHRFAHPLALELECVLADRNVNWDRATNLIGEYRSAMNAIHEQHSPTHMGEPVFRENCKECTKDKKARADNKEWQDGVKRGNEIVRAMAAKALKEQHHDK